MKSTSSLLLAASYALVASPQAFAENKPHWDYQGHGGTTHWADLDEGFKTCKLGKLQSPIDIKPKSVEKAADGKPIGFAYTASTAEVVNNGHTVQVNLPAAGTASIDGVEYKLLQFHFHTPSEERFDGKPYPLVAHMVHKNDKGELAVVAVLFNVGKENAALTPVFAKLPDKEGGSQTLESFNPADLLPADASYYAFMGSLTTPPCSEDVRWQVLKTPVTLSAAQLASFRKLYQMNARPVQPLNGRKVQLVSQ